MKSSSCVNYNVNQSGIPPLTPTWTQIPGQIPTLGPLRQDDSDSEEEKDIIVKVIQCSKDVPSVDDLAKLVRENDILFRVLKKQFQIPGSLEENLRKKLEHGLKQRIKGAGM